MDLMNLLRGVGVVYSSWQWNLLRFLFGICMEYNIVFIDATFSVEGMRPLPSSRAMYSIDQGYPA